MKSLKSILIITFCLLVFSGYSQEHLRFKNVPMDGTVINFTKELIKQGFIVKKENKNLHVLTGNFIGRPCEVRLVATKKTAAIWKVVVLLPTVKDWAPLKIDYMSLKNAFVDKYGEGKSYEFFSKPYAEGESDEMEALSFGRCHYITYWEKPEGTVALQITTEGRITITYEDALNRTLYDKENSQVISNDI